jgi:hypothetical protein
MLAMSRNRENPGPPRWAVVNLFATWGNMTGHMKIHLVNPSDTAFGTAVITPRWLYVLAAATPSEFGDPLIWDETLDPLDPVKIQAGDVVGIGIEYFAKKRQCIVTRTASSANCDRVLKTVSGTTSYR